MTLTREFFESKGWEFGYSFQGILKFLKGDPTQDDGRAAFLHADTKNQTIKITTTDKGYSEDGEPFYSVKYEGPCETEEHFNEICNNIPLKV